MAEDLSQCATELRFQNGYVTFTDCFLTVADQYSLFVNSGSVDSGLSTEFHYVRVEGRHAHHIALNIPSNGGLVNTNFVRADALWKAEATVNDRFENICQNFNGDVRLSAAPGNFFSVSQDVVPTVNGIALFHDCAYTKAEKFWLTAQVVNNLVIQPGDKELEVRHGAPRTIVVDDYTKDVVAGEDISITAHVEDAYSNTVDMCSNPDITFNGYTSSGFGKNGALSRLRKKVAAMRKRAFKHTVLARRNMGTQEQSEKRSVCYLEPVVRTNCLTVRGKRYCNPRVQHQSVCTGSLHAKTLRHHVVHALQVDNQNEGDPDCNAECQALKEYFDALDQQMQEDTAMTTETDPKNTITLEVVQSADDCRAMPGMTVCGNEASVVPQDLTSCSNFGRDVQCCPDIQGVVSQETCGGSVTITVSQSRAQQIYLSVIATGAYSSLEQADIANPILVQPASVAKLEFTSTVHYAVKGVEFSEAITVLGRDKFDNLASNSDACVTLSEADDDSVTPSGDKYIANPRSTLRAPIGGLCTPLQNGVAVFVGYAYEADRESTPVVLQASTGAVSVIHHCSFKVKGLRLRITNYPEQPIAGEDFTITGVVEALAQDEETWVKQSTGTFATTEITLSALSDSETLVLPSKQAVAGEFSITTHLEKAAVQKWDGSWESLTTIYATSKDAATGSTGPIAVRPTTPSEMVVDFFPQTLYAGEVFSFTGVVFDRFDNRIWQNVGDQKPVQVAVSGDGFKVFGQTTVEVYNGGFGFSDLWIQDSSFTLGVTRSKLTVSILQAYDVPTSVAQPDAEPTAASPYPADIPYDVLVNSGDPQILSVLPCSLDSCLTAAETFSICVEALDGYNNRATQVFDYITLRSTGAGWLQGTTEGYLSHGSGRFEVFNEKAEQFYVVAEQSSGFQSWVSAFFSTPVGIVTYHDAASSFKVVHSPTTGVSLIGLDEIRVQYYDQFDNVVNSYFEGYCSDIQTRDTSVRATLHLDEDMAQRTSGLLGVLTVPVVNGVVTFQSGTLSYAQAQWLKLKLVTISATTSVPSQTLPDILIAPGLPAQLEILQQPTSGISQRPLGQPFLLQVSDAAGNILGPGELYSTNGQVASTRAQLETLDSGVLGKRKREWNPAYSTANIYNGAAYARLSDTEVVVVHSAEGATDLGLTSARVSLVDLSSSTPVPVPKDVNGNVLPGPVYQSAFDSWTDAQGTTYLAVFGGSTKDNVQSSSLWVLTVTSTQVYTWHLLSEGEAAPRTGASAAYLNGRLYVVGGRDNGEYKSSTLVFDVSDIAVVKATRFLNEVEASGAHPRGIAEHNAVVHQGVTATRIVVFGGVELLDSDETTNSNHVYTINPKTNTWTLISALPDRDTGLFPAPRTQFGSALFRSQLFVHGGLDLQDYDLWALDLNTFRWQIVATTSTAASPQYVGRQAIIPFPSADGLTDSLVVLGGFSQPQSAASLEIGWIFDLSIASGDAINFVAKSNTLTGSIAQSPRQTGDISFDDLTVTVNSDTAGSQFVQLVFCLESYNADSGDVNALCATSDPVYIRLNKLMFTQGTFGAAQHSVIAGDSSTWKAINILSRTRMERTQPVPSSIPVSPCALLGLVALSAL